MAITNYLLQTMHFSTPSIKKFSCSNNNFTIKNNYFPYKIMASSHNARLKCCIMNSYKPDPENGFDDGDKKVDTLENIVMQALQKNILTGAFLVFSIFLYDGGRLALAASGGRMGGSAFDSFSSSSSSSSPSYSSSSSSYSSSSSSSSSSYSSPSKKETKKKKETNYYSSSPSYSSSYYSSSPSYSSSTSNWWDSTPESSTYSSQTSSPVSPKSSSYSTQTSSPAVSPNSLSDSQATGVFLLVIGIIAICVVGNLLTRPNATVQTKKTPSVPVEATPKASVLKLQVALLGTARTLQKDLNQIAEAADTSTSKGLSYILQEATLALLRHPDYCVSGFSSVDAKKTIEATEKQFNQISIEERAKFDEESLVNINNIRKKSATTQKSNGLHNEYIVVTFIVAASGKHDLPHITNSAELKKALHNLASIPSNKIMAVEVLWTPQNEIDTLSEQELLEDYSLLRPL